MHLFQVIKDPALRERHSGDLQGIVRHEAATINPEAHKASVSHSKDQEIPVCTSKFTRIFLIKYLLMFAGSVETVILMNTFWKLIRFVSRPIFVN